MSNLSLLTQFESSKEPNMTSILTLRRPGRLFTRPEEEKEVASHTAPTSRAPLQKFEDLPVWYQDNPYVRSHYRPVSYSSFACLYSWTYIHNETLNIYTHLISALLSIFAQLWIQNLITTRFPDATIGERLVFALNILAATATLTMSTFYHTLMNHSYHISSLWLRIDYVGILALTLGSFFSGIFVGFYCRPHLRVVYWSMITILALVTSILVLHPRLQGLKFRNLRTAAFVMTAFSGFAPIGHGLWIYGWKEMWERSGMPYWLLEGVVYGVGAGMFATRWPERKWPGRFDVYGTSHQFFHVLVVAAAGVHLWGVWSAYGWNYENQRSCGVGL
jgi:adiponectin receptor